jgi:hypothetical protein
MQGFLVFSLWITLWIALGKTAGMAIFMAGMPEGGVQRQKIKTIKTTCYPYFC